MPTLTRNQIIALVGFIIVLIAIPVSFYLVKQTQIFKSKATGTTTQLGPVTKPPSTTTSNASDLLKTTQSGSPSSSSSAESSGIGLTFGPTLNFTITIEGRPAGKQTDKVFVGLALGAAQVNPSYILTFSIDVPASGIFNGLSLAGLTPGTNYTAYIKGSSTIDTGTTFTMGQNETSLNSGNPVALISGDLNEDNVINAADYAICLGLYGTTPKSANWNPRADFNQDNIVNNFDLIYITRNMGKVGTSGPWVSTPKVSSSSATPSAGLVNKPNVGGPPADFGSVLSSSTQSAAPTEEPKSKSYWMFVP